VAENETQQHERTEQPTPKRLEDARRRGQIPRSRELSMTLVMLAGAGSFLMMRPFLADRLGELLASGLVLERSEIIDAQLLPAMLRAGFSRGIELLVPLWAILVIAAIVGVLSFGGWSFSVEALQPRLEKLNPLRGLRRVFGWSGLSELAKALGKFVLVALVGAFLLWGLAGEFLGLGRFAVKAGLAKAAWLVSLSFAGLSCALILIAVADVPFQAWQYKRRLRMTKQEVKDEQRETEGKPELRSRIRAAQQEIANRRMLEEVPKADVVATNPTHYAVALRYDADAMRAPRVVAKGADLVALNIRRIAEAHGVALFEHPPLAQALFHTTSLGEEIPPRLYVAVAQVLTYVYQLKRRGSAAGGRAEKPAIQIDAELLAEPGMARRLARRRGEG
jgi:flagellar biosynthetic protein FlhB